MTCLDCRDESDARYREKNRDKILTYAQAFRRGITRSDFLKLFELQKERCAICGKKLKLQRARRTDSRREAANPYIDHNHKTGKIRGLLCHGCNTGLGMFGESIESLRSAIAYLARENAS